MFPTYPATVHLLIKQDALPRRGAGHALGVSIKIEWIEDMGILIEKVSLTVTEHALRGRGFAEDRVSSFSGIAHECMHSNIDDPMTAVLKANELRRTAITQLDSLLYEGDWDRAWVELLKELNITPSARVAPVDPTS
jgi:hypothetical protein